MRLTVSSATLGVLCAVSLLSPSPAVAQPADRQGWWTSTNLGVASAPSADVPGDGLLVQGGPISPVALAAVLYTVPIGSQATTLSLKVASGTTATPMAILKLCPLTTPSFSPAQGGPMADAPAYSCDAVSAVASANADGVTFEFDVSALVVQGNLAVAVVPGAASDRVVLAHPGDDSLSVASSAPAGSPQPSTSAQPSTGSVAPPLSGGSDLPAGFGSAQAPAVTGQVPVPVTVAPQPSTAPLVAQGTPDAVPVANAAATPGERNGRTAHLLLLLFGLLVAATMWLSQGSNSTEGSVEPSGATPA